MTAIRHLALTSAAALSAAVALLTAPPVHAVPAPTPVSPPAHAWAAPRVPDPVLVGLHVPWAAGGERLDAVGNLENVAGEWPDVPVHAVRLWDTRTAWLNLEPARGQWDFTRLDRNVTLAAEHGARSVTLVLWGTPPWAARDTAAGDAPWLGPGSAAVPADLADWDAYVRTVATRYAGRIDAYEIGNEPNYPIFFRGTPTELAELTARAARIIHEVDPAAIVVAPAPVVSSAAAVPEAGKYWQALADAHADVDVAAFHWYPASWTSRELARTARAVKAALLGSGLGELPVWVTEVGYQDAPWQVGTLAARTHKAAAAGGISRLYWYAWSSLSIPGLLPLTSGSPLAQSIGRALH